MRRVLLLGIFGLIWACAGAQVGAGYVLEPLGAQPVPVAVRRVTTLIFPAAVRAGVRVSREVQVEKVQGLRNVLVIRAAKAGFAPTNLAVFGVDGRMYSFELCYADSAVAWQYRVVPVGDLGHGLMLSGLPVDEERLGEDARAVEADKGWMKAPVNIKKMRLVVSGVYVADSLVWIAGKLQDCSALGFAIQRVRLYTQDRKRVKRMAVQEAEIDPVFTDLGPGLVAGHGALAFALAYRGIVVPAGKRLVLEMADPDGGRVLRVRIPVKKILAARTLRN